MGMVRSSRHLDENLRLRARVVGVLLHIPSTTRGEETLSVAPLQRGRIGAVSTAAWQPAATMPPGALSRHGARHLAVLAVLPYAGVMAISWLIFSRRFEPVATATAAWDGQHFLAIAEHGYPSSLARGYSNLAFLPGMPVAIRLVHKVGLSYADSGFTVSLLAGAVFVACCAILVARRYGDAAGVRTAALLAVSPGAFLFGLSYSDPLGLCFVAGALLAIDSQRWTSAGILGALATATSPICMPVVLVGFWAARCAGRRAWPAVLMPAGFCLFLVYLWIHASSPATWFLAQDRGWGQGVNVLNVWDRLSESAGIGIPVTVSICLLLAAVGSYAMTQAVVPVAWWIYTAPILAFSIFGRGAWLNPRYLLNAFPLTLAAAVKLRGRSFIVVAMCSLCAMQLAIVAYLVLWPNQVAQP